MTLPPLAAPAPVRAARRGPPSFMFEPVYTRAMRRLADAAAASAKLVLIVAPTGYGKTILMSRWHAELQGAHQASLWLTLDERAVTVEPILRLLEDWLVAPPADQVHPTEALFRGEVSLEERIDALAERLHDRDRPLTVFLDNLQACPDPMLPRLLDRLVLDTPPSLQLVMSSTQEITFDLPRAQLRGLVTTIGASDLGFTTREIGALLGPAVCDRIGHRGVEEVARRTEGWPAAVRMVSLMLGSSEDPVEVLSRVSGNDAQLSRLLQQVLDAFPPAVRRFLLQVAPLHSFCEALCSETLENLDAADRPLAYLLERQAFLVPLERDGGWYRLHGLVRDYLVREARQELGEPAVQALLERAALWCMRQGRAAQALTYAFDARSPHTAAAFLEQIAPTYVRDTGQVAQYLDWVEQLHGMGGQASLEGEYWFAWSLAFLRRHDEARRCCARLLARIGPAPADAATAALQRRLVILQASIASLSDRVGEARAMASDWLAAPHVQDDDPFDLTAAHCIEANAHTLALEFVPARRSIAAARNAAMQARSAHATGWLCAYAAIIEVYSGDYDGADQALGDLLTEAGEARQHLPGLYDMAALVAAKCAVETGLGADAHRLLELGLDSARRHGFLDATACGLDAAVKLWSGREEETWPVERLRRVATGYAPRLATMLSCYLIRRMVLLGQLEAALDEASRIGLDPLQPDRYPADHALVLALVRATCLDLLVATHRHRQAEPLLELALKQAREHACWPDQVDLTLLHAGLAVRGGNVVEARHLVGKALRAAAPRRIVRPCLDRAPSLAPLIASSPAEGWGWANEAERRLFRTMQQQCGAAPPTAPAEPDLPPLALLTAREAELLTCIDQGLSNQQMAERLAVSLTTVKWHLQNLYNKLNVRTRSAALARARHMGLLRG